MVTIQREKKGKKGERRVKLTKAVVTFAACQGDRPEYLWDSEVIGFGVRVFPTGAKTWVISYREQGGGRGARKRIVNLQSGTSASLTPDQARAKAKAELARLALGGDGLAAERQARRIGDTVGEVLAAYETDHLPKLKPASATEARRLIARYIIPVMGHRKIRDVKKADLAALHAAMSAGRHPGCTKPTPTQANRVLSLLSRVWRFATDHGVLSESAANPARGHGRNPEREGSRYLTANEMPRLAAALEAEPNRPAALAIALLLATGCRKSEILTARRKWVDVDAGTLHLPDTKAGRPRTVILTASALELVRQLDAIRPTDNPWLVPGDEPGAHLVNLDKPWRRIRAAAGLDDVRIHDLRHTCGTWLASQGVPLQTIAMILGHSSFHVTKRYAHVAEAVARAALDESAVAMGVAMGGATKVTGQ